MWVNTSNNIYYIPQLILHVFLIDFLFFTHKIIPNITIKQFIIQSLKQQKISTDKTSITILRFYN